MAGFSELPVEQIRTLLISALVETAAPLKKIAYTKENYTALFSGGTLETPVETVKMGGNQFEKFAQKDRNYLIAAAYQTLAIPSLVFRNETLDKKTNSVKEVHIYGKSFYNPEKGKARAVESVVVFKEGRGIVIGTHNKDFSRFIAQIKTTDQLIYTEEAVGRIIGRCATTPENVRTESINAQFLNRGYSENSILSIDGMLAAGLITPWP